MAFGIRAPEIKATNAELLDGGHLIFIARQMKFCIVAESDPTLLPNVLQPLIIRGFRTKKMFFPVLAGHTQFSLFGMMVNDF